MIKRMMLWAAMALTTGTATAGQLMQSLGPARVSPATIAEKPTRMQATKAMLANVTENQRLVSASAAAHDFFGQAVATDGNTAVIGIWGNDAGAAQSEGDGAVEVWLRTGNTWALQQRLVSGDAGTNEQFGWSVAISGDTLVVGSPLADASGSDSGSVFVYTRSAGVWTLQTQLTSATVDSNDNFGFAVAIEGDTLIASARRDEVGAVNAAGAAYVYTRTAGVWTQQGDRLVATGGLEGDVLGTSVDLSGDYAVVGADSADTAGGEDAGAAYIFRRVAGVWSQQGSPLVSNAPAAFNQFGRSVAIDNGTIVVSDHRRSSSTGRAIVFTGSGASWTVQQTLSASDGQSGDVFGHAVSIQGETILVGAYQADLVANSDRGAAYKFTRSGSVWSQIDKYFASDAGGALERFGFGVALTSSVAIAGAPLDQVGSIIEAGSAYVFHLGTPTSTVQIINPTTATFNESIALTAQVSGGTPTGNVEFRDGANVLVMVPLNGSGIAATNLTLNAGSYSIRAFYLGDSVHSPSNSTAQAVTINKASTSMALNTSGSPSVYGNNVTFTANLAVTPPGGGVPAGSVQFFDDGVLVSTQPLVAGVAQFTTNALTHNGGADHPITASYAGTANYNGSSAGPQNHVVNKATPSLTLFSSPNPSFLGQNVTLTGTLTGGLAPTGTVTFFDGISLMGSNPVVAGVATRNTSSLTMGAHNLQATYAGDDNHNDVQTAAPIVHTVQPSADVSVTKTNGTTFVQSGEVTTYTIVVTNPAGGVAVDGLLVNDVLDPDFFDVGAATWSCAPAGICTPEAGTGSIVDLPLDLAPDSLVTITLTVPVLASAEAGVANTVTLTMPGGVGDPDLADNTATDTDGSGLFKDSFEDVPASIH